MARYNVKAGAYTAKSTQVGPMGTTSKQGTTHGGATGWLRDEKSEFFLRLTGSFVGQDSYYEKADERDGQLIALARKIAPSDFEWLATAIVWARTYGNQRTGPIIAAVEAVDFLVKSKESEVYQSKDGGPSLARTLINEVCQRADEPGEMLAYWRSTRGNVHIPKPIKRGLADAVQRLYTQRGFLRYDSQAAGVRFGDVLEIVHASPDPSKHWQGDLFQWAITARHGREADVPATLKSVVARKTLSAMSPPARHAIALSLGEPGLNQGVELAMAGQWEWLLSWLGEGGEKKGILSKARQWELAIPQMGYMALLRNLRNFDEAGISEEFIDQVIGRLTSPDEVKTSRQMPFRFLSAYLNAPSDNWRRALNQAANLCLENVPVLGGRTLIAVDVSGSMDVPMSKNSKITRMAAGALFGMSLMLKNRADADMILFGTGTMDVTPKKGASLLAATEDVERVGRVGSLGWSTNMDLALKNGFKGHDRVVIVSDMQAFPGGRGGVGANVPATTPIYCFNLNAYSTTPFKTGSLKRVDLGGMTDHTFSLIRQMETAANGTWPWES